jgi:hypothetical protein
MMIQKIKSHTDDPACEHHDKISGTEKVVKVGPMKV